MEEHEEGVEEVVLAAPVAVLLSVAVVVVVESTGLVVVAPRHGS